MQNTEESDLGPEMFGIGRDFQQGCSAGAEQKIIDDLFVLQSQPGELVRESEDNMHVAHGQQLFLAVGEPPIAGVSLALRTVSRSAGVEGSGFMSALATAIQMSTERRRAAMLDGKENAEMQPRQPGAVPFDEAVAMRANNVCHLERWPCHFLCSLRDRFTWSGVESSMLSSGVPAALMWRSDR